MFFLVAQITSIWAFPKIVVPQNGWFIMENLLKWMIWGYHYFRKPPYLETKKIRRFILGPTFQASSDGGSHTDEETCSLGNFDVQTWMCLRRLLTDSTMEPVNHHFSPPFGRNLMKLVPSISEANPSKVVFFVVGNAPCSFHSIPYYQL